MKISNNIGWQKMCPHTLLEIAIIFKKQLSIFEQIETSIRSRVVFINHKNYIS